MIRLLLFLTSLLLLNSTLLAKEVKKPNVLFIVVDDLNAWIGHHKIHPLAKTPHMDRLAASGLSFTNAHCSAPVCVASRASFMSGVHPSKSGLYTNAGWKSAHKVISETPHMLELFKQAGYNTLGAGKIYHNWVSDTTDVKLKPALPLLHSTWYDRYLPQESAMPSAAMLPDGEGYGMPDTGRGNIYYPFPDGGTRLRKELGVQNGISLSAGAVDRSKLRDGKMPDEVIAEWGVNEIKKLAQAKSNKPFFMALGFIRPHVPFSAPQKYFDQFPLESIELPKPDDMKDIPLYGKAMTTGIIDGGDHAAVEKLGDTFWKQLIQGYLASIAFVDDQIGKVLDQLEESRLSENTMIVLISDHGQNLGEKKNWRKMSLWEESTKVPFIVRMPGSKYQNQKFSSAVSLLDIYPTFAEIIGLPPQKHADGNSLLELINKPQTPWNKPVLTSWFHNNFAVRSNRYRYIRYRDGSEELYDHANDPKEYNNLAKNPEATAIISKLKAFIPAEPALPFGSSSFQEDVLDKRVKDFKAKGLPDYLK